MDEILEFLIKYLSFLYNEYGFKFVDSMSSKSFGGDGFLVLRSEHIALRFVNDRSQLFLDLRSTQFDKKNDWHSIDLVKQLITGDVSENSVLNEEIVFFLKDHINDILEKFGPKEAKSTIVRLKKFKVERAKRLFG